MLLFDCTGEENYGMTENTRGCFYSLVCCICSVCYPCLFRFLKLQFNFKKEFAVKNEPEYIFSGGPDKFQEIPLKAEPEEVPTGALRDLTPEEMSYLFDNCLNQLHFFQEEDRLRRSPTEHTFL
jgi:hypothetical protein